MRLATKNSKFTGYGMRLSFFKNTFFLFVLVCFSCGSQNKDPKANVSAKIGNTNTEEVSDFNQKQIVTGADQPESYLPLLRSKNVGFVGNQSSLLHTDTGPVHMVDFLLSKNINVKIVFSPEHGFRGVADAGELVKDGLDTKTGVPIISLYGKNKKLPEDQLEGIDVLVFDIQDIGVRFYTYISTLHYVMEACAKAGVPIVILDRPNPNGHYIDGPVLEPQFKSFLGMHTVPLVHGMTIGEYALMINGEGWLTDQIQCSINVIKVLNYTHQTPYSVPVRPSPNLPNDVAINLYPSLGLLEGTNLNEGRGTEMQFQLIGSPYLPKEKYPFTYIPQSNFGSKNPKFKDVPCNGLDLRNTPKMNRIDLTWIIDAYRNYKKKESFFNTENFTTHAGTEKLQGQIEKGYTFRDIRATWLPELKKYDAMREKYLLYDR